MSAGFRVDDRRPRGSELPFAVWMLGLVGVAIWRGEPLWFSAGGLVAMGARVARARGRFTPTGGFGVANSLTALRLTLCAALPLLFPVLARPSFAALVLLLFVLDGVDGWLAKTRDEVSA